MNNDVYFFSGKVLHDLTADWNFKFDCNRRSSYINNAKAHTMG